MLKKQLQISQDENSSQPEDNNNEPPSDAACSKSKRIRKKKSRNNDHLLIRKKEYSIQPIYINQFQQYQYHLFNDIIIDFDIFDSPKWEQPLKRGFLWQTFKSITQVNIINEGTFMNWTQENFNQPHMNTNHMVHMLKSLSSQAAYKQANDLSIINQYLLTLTNYLSKMKPEFRVNFFQQRRQHSIAKANEYIKNHPRNCVSLINICNYNDKQQSHEYRSMGFSKKLLSLIGIDIKDAPNILLRRGYIDICSKQQQALISMKRNSLSFLNHQMPEVIEFKREGEHITLEGIPFKCIQHIRIYNSTYQFDRQYCPDIPIKPDTVAESFIEVPEDELRKIYEIRSSLTSLSKYTLDDFVNGEFSYQVQVEDFLLKHYNTASQYRKCRSLQSFQQISSRSTVVLNRGNHNFNSLEKPSTISSLNNSDIVKQEQQQQNLDISILSDQYHKTKSEISTHLAEEEQQANINQSEKTLNGWQSQDLSNSQDISSLNQGDNEIHSSSGQNNVSLSKFLNEFKYNPIEANILPQEFFNFGTY